MDSMTLYGIQFSPYVRKVRLALAHKDLAYEHIPVVPIGGSQPPEFKANSPLGKIPLLRVGDNWLPDSSAICAWMDRAAPQPPLLPVDPIAAARGLWYEEYADSRMVAVIGGHLFVEVVLAKALMQREPIQADIDAAINVEIPQIFDYLESQLQANYLLGAEITLADYAVGSLFVTLLHCKYQCDAKRWPKVAAYIDRLVGSALFTPIIAEEKQVLASMGVK